MRLYLIYRSYGLKESNTFDTTTDIAVMTPDFFGNNLRNLMIDIFMARNIQYMRLYTKFLSIRSLGLNLKIPEFSYWTLEVISTLS